MSNPGKAPVYYLPVEQTVYQKCLIDIMIQLHEPHIRSYLQRLKDKKTTDNNGDDTNDNANETSTNSNNGTMSDDSMMEAFIFNVKQITNHPTLLVDHYIPRNLLLLSSKENIIDLSNKYHQISEILDKLVERDVRKTIIISVSNAKEMDLIESFLLGKTGLQYYRFSGSSLYYDNHGSFDFHKASKLQDEENTNDNNQLENFDDSHVNQNTERQTKKRKNVRNKKVSGSNSTPANGSSYNNSSSNNNTEKKKKTGRQSNAEKRAREQHAQVSAAIAAATSSDQTGDSDPTLKTRENREEYIPKLSKNNSEFCAKLLEKKSKKLNVYLILSSQLKYLLQFEDLKSDLILSLDSNFTNFDDLSSILDHQVPILKPIVIESLEHYEWELNNNKDNIIYDINQPIKRQRNHHNDNNNLNAKIKFNKLLVLLSIAAWPNVNVKLQSNISPISDNLINWLIDPTKNLYPFNRTTETNLSHILDDSLFNKVYDTLNLPYKLANTLGVKKLDEYKFFDLKLDLHINNKDDDTNKQDKKRIKLNPNDNLVPSKFNYSLYQFHLTHLLNDTLTAMQVWQLETEKQLKFVHLDETERQFIIDKGNEECGELFKQDRDLGVKLEAREKVNEKLNSEVLKFESILVNNEGSGLKQRFENYSNTKAEDVNIEEKNNEVKLLMEKLESLTVNIKEAENESNNIRLEYQEKSSKAAELSAITKNLETVNKTLQEESKGRFKEIQLNSIVEKKKYLNKKINELNNDCSMWNGYLEILNAKIEKKSSLVNNNAISRVARRSRNNTPY